MDVVRQAPYLADDNVVVRRNGAEHGRDLLAGQGVGKDAFAVFRAPSKVVPQFITSMAGVEDRHRVVRLSHPGQVPHHCYVRSDSPMPEHGGLAR